MDQEVEARLRGNVEHFVLQAGPEHVKIRELYGDGWDEVAHPTRVGQEFSRMVKAGEFPGLEAVPRDEWINKNNHVEYRRRRV